jgi:hypothetical protein
LAARDDRLLLDLVRDRDLEGRGLADTDFAFCLLVLLLLPSPGACFEVADGRPAVVVVPLAASTAAAGDAAGGSFF